MHTIKQSSLSTSHSSTPRGDLKVYVSDDADSFLSAGRFTTKLFVHHRECLHQTLVILHQKLRTDLRRVIELCAQIFVFA